ncbi:hypothetical protein [Agrococcus jenensis]|uniref:Uncharacterized protein n=1 Tax=Agrococcus jenensis TaxID=46353 RepID=A0A3N2AQP4_9MICO|nr:hypothetical protein [Agrococcus jenensis]ROR65360.1 hypothetical protein EDD26_0726 [Agrococcus jenensis]
MMIATRPSARAVGAAAALAAAVLLVGCGPDVPTAPSETAATPSPAVETARPTPVEPTPTGSVTPAPTITPAPTSTPMPTEMASSTFETQNGTMRLQLPEGWTVLDNSRLTMDFDGDPWWENTVGFTSPSGTDITYYDGFGDSAGYLNADFGIVEERAMDIAGTKAMSWWVHAADRWFVHAGVARPSQEGLEPIPSFGLPDVERTHTCTVLLLGDDQAAVGSRAEAEQLLSSAPVLEALDVMATLELTGVDPSTMPAGVEP